MSKNTNRARLNKAESRTQYHRILLKMMFPPYWDEDYNWVNGMPRWKKRSYRSWKYNRKTQYK